MARQQTFTREELLKCGNGTMYDPDTPRLPLPNMLMLDRITHVSEEGGSYGRGEIIAELDIRPDLWFFACHFEGDPVMPGCLGLDGLWQMLGFYMGWLGHKGTGRAIGVKEVKFAGEVLPTSKIVRYHLNIRRVMSLKIVLAAADGTVSVDGKEIYRATGLKVGVFESTDNM